MDSPVQPAAPVFSPRAFFALTAIHEQHMRTLGGGPRTMLRVVAMMAYANSLRQLGCNVRTWGRR